MGGETSRKSGSNVFEEIPEDVVILVLSYVPAKDLMKNCVHVSKRWKVYVDIQRVWRLKCEREKKYIPGVFPVPESFKRYYFLCPYTRNLVKNPRALEQFKYWQIVQEHGDNFAVEDVAAGSRPIREFVTFSGEVKNWATSYGWCVKRQLIDLIKEGCDISVLDELRPDIEVSEWYAARFDCGCKYNLTVRLLSANKEKVDEFEFEDMIDQWIGKDWHQAHHVFTGYPPGVRYVLFIHAGKDTQFWAGYYGSKFTMSSVTFKFK